MSATAAITVDPIDLVGLHQWAKHPLAGAVVTFSGITRDNCDGKKVQLLSYDCYQPRALRSLQKIAEATLEVSGVQKCAIVHRIGPVPLSEESLLIVISAAHRGEAWKAAEECLEEVKRSVEIWKREVFEDGSSEWIEGCARCK